jgi:hypothetical protein
MDTFASNYEAIEWTVDSKHNKERIAVITNFGICSIAKCVIQKRIGLNKDDRID